VGFCSVACEGWPALRHLFLHGHFCFYWFAKMSLTLLEIFSLNICQMHWKDPWAYRGPSSVKLAWKLGHLPACSQLGPLQTPKTAEK